MQVNLLDAIKKTLSAYNIHVTTVLPPYEELPNFDYGLRTSLEPDFDWTFFGNTLLELPDNEILFLEGIFGLRFVLFRLPGEEGKAYIAGPWANCFMSAKRQQNILELLGQDVLDAVLGYRNGVGVIDEPQMRSAFLSLLSMARPKTFYKIRENRNFMPMNLEKSRDFFRLSSFRKDIPASMLEQRYLAENRLMDAVRSGDVAAALKADAEMKRFDFNGRFRDTLYQIKNKMIILNTLYRKAIEAGGVHPVYVDDISARYSSMIEHMLMEDESTLRDRMLKEYCRYVQLYTLQNYSPVVQKAINHIRFNLSDSLTLKTVAASCNMNPSYLSSLFRQETASTLTEYISRMRAEQAAVLLETTELSISDISAQVGISDANYFIKIFKKVMGCTPSSYRSEYKSRKQFF